MKIKTRNVQVFHAEMEIKPVQANY